MRIELMSMDILHFKGIRELHPVFNGKDAILSGENGSGKTSVCDAFMWLFYNKESEQGRSDFSVVPLDSDNRPIHDIEVSVSATLSVDGEKRVFKRVLKERVVKKRKEVLGYTSEYWTDDVPRQQKQFVAEVDAIADTETFRLLTDPMYFCNILKPAERRSRLVELAGDVPKPKGYEALIEKCGRRTMAEQKKVWQDAKRLAAKARDEIPTRIDELLLSLPETADTQELTKRRQQISCTQAQIEQGYKELADKQEARTAKLADIELLQSNQAARARHLASDTSAIEDYIKAKQDRLKTLADSGAGVGVKLNELRASQGRLDTIKLEIETWVAKRKKLQADRAALEGAEETPEKCFNCGQDMPAETQKAAKDAKAERLAGFDKQCEEARATLEAKQEELEQQQKKRDALKSELEKAEHAHDKIHADADKCIAELDKLIAESPTPKPEKDDKWCELGRKIKEATESLGPSCQQEMADLRTRLQGANTALAEVNKLLARADQAAETAKRIETLKEEEEKKSQLIADLEADLATLDAYCNEESELLVDAVNGKFEYVTFKLFEPLLGGDGFKDCCEAVYDNGKAAISYPDASTGQKMVVGVDICSAFVAHLGIAPPIWVDHWESITLPIKTRSQMIRLEVKEKEDLKLTTDG